MPTYTQQQYDAKDWYVSPGGNIWYATGAKGDLLKYAAGWQGPMTYAQAQAIAKTTPAPLRNVNKAATGAADATANAVGGSTGALEDIGNFFHELSQAAVWERVGEVLLGGILLFIGVRAMTQGSNVAGSQARKAATKPVKSTVKAVARRVAPPPAKRVIRESHVYHHRSDGTVRKANPPTAKKTPAKKSS